MPNITQLEARRLQLQKDYYALLDQHTDQKIQQLKDEIAAHEQDIKHNIEAAQKAYKAWHEAYMLQLGEEYTDAVANEWALIFSCIYPWSMDDQPH